MVFLSLTNIIKQMKIEHKLPLEPNNENINVIQYFKNLDNQFNTT